MVEYSRPRRHPGRMVRQRRGGIFALSGTSFALSGGMLATDDLALETLRIERAARTAGGDRERREIGSLAVVLARRARLRGAVDLAERASAVAASCLRSRAAHA